MKMFIILLLGLIPRFGQAQDFGLADVGFMGSISAHSKSTVVYVAVTGQTLGTLRNDSTSARGWQFQVDPPTITVTALGRWVVAGNSGTHTVRLRDASCVDLATVTVDTSGKTAGQYSYTDLVSSVQLVTGVGYFIMSDETSGGDQWYNNDTIITVSSDITMGLSAHSACVFSVGGGAAYVPVSFKYTKP